jgi:hypothetical protein
MKEAHKVAGQKSFICRKTKQVLKKKERERRPESSAVRSWELRLSGQSSTQGYSRP